MGIWSSLLEIPPVKVKVKVRAMAIYIAQPTAEGPGLPFVLGTVHWSIGPLILRGLSAACVSAPGNRLVYKDITKPA